MPYRKILIAVDENPPAYRAAQAGLALAAALRAEVGLVFVLDERLSIGNVETGPTGPQALAQLHATGERLLDQLAGLAPAGVPISRFLPAGAPAREVVAVAEMWGADLLVMGTHARTGLPRLLLGSAADEVIARAHCPVLVVPFKEG